MHIAISYLAAHGHYDVALSSCVTLYSIRCGLCNEEDFSKVTNLVAIGDYSTIMRKIGTMQYKMC
jgi:hypothetical protein